MSRRPTSSLAACVWIPLFPLRCEEARHDGLAAYPTALLAPDTTRKLWQVSSLARHAGVKPGMTVSQAIGLCSSLRLIEPDPVHYDDRFAALLSALNEVSPVVEAAELGLAYVGCDGLEGIYGGPEMVVEAIRHTSHAARVGVGLGKFTAWVAASRAKPSEAIVVRVGEEQKFLAPQPIAVLPQGSDTHRRLRQLGIRTLGALSTLPEAAVTAQFGDVGRRLWQLAAGRIAEPVEGRVTPEPIVAALTFFTPVGERELLVHSVEQLITRALKHPRRIGWRVHAVRLRADLESPTNRSWLANILLKDPTADADRIAAPLRTRLEQSPPTGAVERLVLEFTAFAPGTTELQLFARDAQAAARAGQQRALQSAARAIRMRVKRSSLYHIVEVQPWSRLPERRYALIDYEP